MVCVSSVETSVLRSDALATPAAAPFETVVAGTEFALDPGDSFIGLPDAGGEFRNDGGEVVLLIAGISPELVDPA